MSNPPNREHGAIKRVMKVVSDLELGTVVRISDVERYHLSATGSRTNHTSVSHGLAFLVEDGRLLRIDRCRWLRVEPLVPLTPASDRELLESIHAMLLRVCATLNASERAS